MDILHYGLQMILSLSILVVLHEFGHYLPAKWFKTRVEKFYLFFNPRFSLYKKQIGETEWGIGWIPFGGYVKIAGMIDESMDKEQMQQEPQPWEFRSKKAWQRLIIMIGGVTVNFILGLVLFAMIVFVWGESYIKTSDAKYGIAVDSMGKVLGLQDGDLVLKADTTTLPKFNPGLLVKEIVLNNTKELTVMRNGEEIKLPVPEDMPKTLSSFENKNKVLYYPRVPLEMIEPAKGGNAEIAGVQKGDKILAVEGREVEFVHEYKEKLYDNKGKNIQLMLIRNNSDTMITDVAVNEKGAIGIQLKTIDHFITMSKQEYGFFESIPKGVGIGVNFLGDQLKAFGQMFSGKLKASENLGSIFSIASMFDPGWNWEVFWRITASLSILLAFFNLLPIPALDGGYVLFLLWEVVTGKAPNDKFMEVVTYIGFIILVTLMIFALGLDISRWF